MIRLYDLGSESTSGLVVSISQDGNLYSGLVLRHDYDQNLFGQTEFLFIQKQSIHVCDLLWQTRDQIALTSVLFYIQLESTVQPVIITWKKILWQANPLNSNTNKIKCSIQTQLCKNTIDYAKSALLLTGLACHKVLQCANTTVKVMYN